MCCRCTKTLRGVHIARKKTLTSVVNVKLWAYAALCSAEGRSGGSSGLNLSVPLSASLCLALFFSSSIHVTNDKVQCLCPYIDLCSVWSGWGWDDGAHTHTHICSVLRHLGALGNVSMHHARAVGYINVSLSLLVSCWYRNSSFHEVHSLGFFLRVKAGTVSMIWTWLLIGPLWSESVPCYM